MKEQKKSIYKEDNLSKYLREEVCTIGSNEDNPFSTEKRGDTLEV